MDPSALDSAISILENEISGLEKYVDGLEVWLWMASAAVVIGVVAEMYFILREYLEDRKAWRKGSISSPHRPSMILVLELASVFLVVAGVAGELAVGIMSGNANSHLRGMNTHLVGLVRQKATVAQERAEVADRELIRLRTPRFLNLTKEARGRIALKLSPFKRRFVWVNFQAGSFDAPELAQQLAPILSTEEIGPSLEDRDILQMYQINSITGLPAPYVFGVEVIYFADGEASKAAGLPTNKPLANAITEALTNEGIDAHATPEQINSAADLENRMGSSPTQALHMWGRLIVRIGAIPLDSAVRQKSATASTP